MEWGVLIPIAGLSIPIVAIIMGNKRKMLEMQLEETRLRSRGGGDGVLEELDDLREDFKQLSSEVSEMQERLDFTERLLAQARKQDGLSPGPPSA